MDMELSHRVGIVTTPLNRRHTTMFHQAHLIRLLAIPACLVWAVAESIALQKARWAQRQARPLKGR